MEKEGLVVGRGAFIGKGMGNNMNKKTFHKKWYYRLLQVIFWGSFILAIYPGIWAVLYEDDMPFVGFIWIGVLAIVYFLIKRIFYHIMFSDNILPLKKQKR